MKVDNFDPRKWQFVRIGAFDWDKIRPRFRLGGKVYFQRKPKETRGLKRRRLRETQRADRLRRNLFQLLAICFSLPATFAPAKKSLGNQCCLNISQREPTAGLRR
jgi:hypothetical protein